MSGDPDVTVSPDAMAHWERWLDYYAALDGTEGTTYASSVRAELDRLRAALATAAPVVEAAREYLDELESPAPDYTMRKILRDRLAARVRAHTEERKAG